MAQLAGPAPDKGDIAMTLERVCLAAVALVDASGAGVSLMADHGIHSFAAASDAVSRRIEELQFTLGEGPCLDAFSTGQPVLVPDLSESARDRWPIYTAEAQAVGIRAVFAFPIQIGGSRLGVLDVFRDRPGVMTGEQVGQAVTLADVALMMALDAQQAAPAGSIPYGFDQAHGFPAEIAQAQGMIMVQLGITITEALVRLRAHAFAEGRPLNEVARDVVARRIHFDEIGP
jgi:hypothetical protein